MHDSEYLCLEFEGVGVRQLNSAKKGRYEMEGDAYTGMCRVWRG